MFWYINVGLSAPELVSHAHKILSDVHQNLRYITDLAVCCSPPKLIIRKPEWAQYSVFRFIENLKQSSHLNLIDLS